MKSGVESTKKAETDRWCVAGLALIKLCQHLACLSLEYIKMELLEKFNSTKFLMNTEQRTQATNCKPKTKTRIGKSLRALECFLSRLWSHKDV